MGGLLDFYQKAKKKLQDWEQPIQQSVSSGLGQAYNSAKNYLGDVGNDISNYGKSTIDYVEKAPEKISNYLNEDVVKPTSDFLNSPSPVNVPEPSIVKPIENFYKSGPLVQSIQNRSLKPMAESFGLTGNKGFKLGNYGQDNPNPLENKTFGLFMPGDVGGAAKEAVPNIVEEAGKVVQDFKNAGKIIDKPVPTKAITHEPIPGVFSGGQPVMRQLPEPIIQHGNFTESVPYEPQSALSKANNFIKNKVGLTVEDVSGKPNSTIDDAIAQKRAKAKALVEKQIENQKAGSSTAEPGFVAPQMVKKPEPKIVYHSSAFNIDGDLRASKGGNMGEGVYLHEDPNVARVAGAEQADGNILDQTAHPVKINTAKIYRFKNYDYPDETLVNTIKKQGYDGIRTGSGELVIFDPKNVSILSDGMQKGEIANPKKPLPTIEEYVNGSSEKKSLPSIEEFVNGKTTEAQAPVVDKALERIKPEWRNEYNMIRDDLKNVVKDEADQMMAMKNELGGVGTYQKAGEGQIGGDMGVRRFSSNPQWYRDFYEKNGRAPRKYEVMKIAEDNLKNGNGINTEKYNATRRMLLDMEGESLKASKNIGDELNPQYNKYQQRAFDKKQNRINQIDALLNYPNKLREIGYKAREIDRVGKNEASRILQLADLGYPKNQIDTIVKNFDMTDKILKNKVSWSELSKYYEKKKALNTNFLEGVDPTGLNDINPSMGGMRDVYRNFEVAFGKHFPTLKERLLDPFDQAKGNFIKDQQSVLKELEDNVVNKLGIQKGSKLSEYVQKYGENKLIRPLEESDIPDNIKLQLNLEELKSLAEKTKSDWRMLAAKKLDNMPNEKKQIVLNQIKQLEPDKWQNIIQADNWFREKYNTMLDELNKVREENFPTHPLYPESSKIIPKRNDYYRHFQDISSGFQGLKNIFDTPANIDPSLAVSSEFTEPKSRWLSFAQKRKGDRTTYDAVGGFLDYLKSHSYAKNIDPFIQQFRGVDAEAKDIIPYENPRIGLAEELSQKTDPVQQITGSRDQGEIKKILMDHGVSDAQSEWMSKELADINEYDKTNSFLKNKLAKNKQSVIDSLTTPEAKAESSDNKMNNFLKFLNNYANDLAGKTNPYDRPVQDFFGRKAFKALNWTNSRVKANTVLGNVGSMISQFFNVPQGFADAGVRNSVKGLGDTLAGVFKDNPAMQKSDFIRERYFDDYAKFNPGILNNAKRFAMWMTEVGDEIGTKFIWNSEYRKALSSGEANPVKFADDWTRRMVAGRGVGEVPILQKSKMHQLVNPFQVEVANQWHALRDVAANSKNGVDLAGKMVKFAVASYLMNYAKRQITGSGASFDPLNAAIDAYNEFQNEDDKIKGGLMAGGRMAGEVISNLPGAPILPTGQTLASIYPEFGGNVLGVNLPVRKDFFGEGDPTRFGSGLLSTKAVQDPLYKLMPPFAGGQIEKTVKGTVPLIKGYAENNAGKVMTPVKRDITNVMRGVLFGQNALGEVQNYYDNNQKPLSDKQSEIFKATGNGYFDQVTADRAASAEAKALKGGKATGNAQKLSDGMYQLSNGDIYVKSLNRTFKSMDDANKGIKNDALAKAKKEFQKSDKNFQDMGDYVFQKDASGNPTVKKKIVFTSELNTAKMTNAKNNKDMKTWMQIANDQYRLYNQMLQDPNTDELEKTKIQNSMNALAGQVAKYKEYGGFTKGKKAPKLEEKYRYPLVDPEMIKIQSMIAGYGGSKKPILSKKPLPLVIRRLPAVHRTRRR